MIKKYNQDNENESVINNYSETSFECKKSNDNNFIRISL